MSHAVWTRFRDRRAALAGLIALLVLIALSLAAPAIAPQDPTNPLGFDPLAANHPPDSSWTYLLGADGRGRGVLSLLLWGGRVTLSIGLGAALLSTVIGVVLGMLACWRGGRLDPAISWLMDVCQAAPPLLVLLVLAGRLGGVPATAMIAAFAATGWVAPARITRAAAGAAAISPYVEAARAVGVSGRRLLFQHLLPAALAPVAAWLAGAAATFMVLEAGLDFLGLGLPQSTISWGAALAGAQEALALGNWWWMTFGGLALAGATLSMGAIARGIGVALDPCVAPASAPPAAEEEDQPDASPVLGALWRSWQPAAPALSAARRPRLVMLLGIGTLLVILGLAARVGRQSDAALPRADVLLQRALTYQAHTDQSSAYFLIATYAATEAILGGRRLPWAAWGDCPEGLHVGRCGQSELRMWFNGGNARALSEGILFICTPRITWGLNPMAGLAQTQQQGCGPVGPDVSGLGATAGVVRSLLPRLQLADARVVGQDVAAGQRCWLLALAPDGRACIDASTGLLLRLERLDHAGLPAASYNVTAINYGLDLASALFTNPIPGGRGPLINSLSQALLSLQAADDQALFSALVPSTLPEGLIAQTPTFDSYYDDRQGYALEQRVRQAYINRSGHIALVLIETTPGSGWDVTPPRPQARQIQRAGHQLLVWRGAHGTGGIVRIESTGTAAIVSSNVLPVSELVDVAAGLQ